MSGELRDRLATIAPEPRRPLDLPALRQRAARSRCRSRMKVSLAAGLAVAAAVAGVAVATAGGSSSRVTTVTGPTPASHELFAGLTVDAVDFLNSRDGIVVVGGRSGASGPVRTGWVETTTDGGAHWTISGVQPASRSGFPLGPWAAMSGQLSMVDPSAGWDLADGLWETTDGGRRWIRQLAAGPLSGLAVADGTAWALERGEVFRSAGSTFTATPGQPPVDAGSLFGSLASASAADVFGIWNPTKTGAPMRLARTIDGGRRWSIVPLPCATQDGDGGAYHLAPGPAGSLWVDCFLNAGSSDASEGPQTLYRSGDGGTTWQQVTAGQPTRTQIAADGLDDPLVDLDMVDQRGGWALETDDEAGNGPVEHTSDGGRTWTAVLTRTVAGHPDQTLAIGGLYPSSATTAWVTASLGQREMLLHTTDSGRHWTTVVLPTPPAARR